MAYILHYIIIISLLYRFIQCSACEHKKKVDTSIFPFKTIDLTRFYFLDRITYISCLLSKRLESRQNKTIQLNIYTYSKILSDKKIIYTYLHQYLYVSRSNAKTATKVFLSLIEDRDITT